jgi:hypothetical protein
MAKNLQIVVNLITIKTFSQASHEPSFSLADGDKFFRHSSLIVEIGG